MLSVILIGLVLWSLSNVKWNDPIFHPGGTDTFRDFLEASIRPELSAAFILLVIQSAWTTVTYAVAGLCLGMLVGIVSAMTALWAGRKEKSINRFYVAAIRIFLAFLRAVHELVWAWLFIIGFGLTPMAAILALAIPYGGILGRVYYDSLLIAPEPPIRALQLTGATDLKILIYGQLPLVFPNLVSYTFYRFECAIRAATVMGFVGIGGLGMQIELSLSDLLFNEVWTLLYAMIFLIVVVDVWSSVIRKTLTK
jgi:phosphonate transport system permease protein